MQKLLSYLKFFGLFSGLFFGWVPEAHALPIPSQNLPFRVVIDPGHGGADQGTVYRGRDGFQIAEKNITLAISQRIAEILRAQGTSVILTRNSDIEVPLPARTSLANRLKADVFLSIHMNSTPSAREGLRAGEGIETYILSHTTDASSRRLSELENRGIAGEAFAQMQNNPPNNPQNNDVALILKDLRLDASLSESKRLACSIQKGLVNSSLSGVPVVDRGVKQALFYVLLGADMPSALVETGFLSNPRDRSYLLSNSGQQSVAEAIARGLNQFKRNQGTRLAESTLSNCIVH